MTVHELRPNRRTWLRKQHAEAVDEVFWLWVQGSILLQDAFRFLPSELHGLLKKELESYSREAFRRTAGFTEPDQPNDAQILAFERGEIEL